MHLAVFAFSFSYSKIDSSELTLNEFSFLQFLLPFLPCFSSYSKAHLHCQRNSSGVFGRA